LLHDLEEYHNISIDEVSTDQVKEFLQHSIAERNFSASYVNQVISAFRILQEDVLGKE
jgi:hypothetical protein